MKFRLLAAICLACLAVPAFAQDLVGTWKGQISDPQSGDHPITIQFKEAGGKVVGTMTGGPPRGDEQPITDVQLKGTQLSFTVTTGDPNGPPTIVLKGTVSGNHIKGTMDGPPGVVVVWEATRQ